MTRTRHLMVVTIVAWSAMCLGGAYAVQRRHDAQGRSDESADAVVSLLMGTALLGDVLIAGVFVARADRKMRADEARRRL